MGKRGYIGVTVEQLTDALGTEYKSLQEVGDILGITRERVRQLVNKRGITRVPRPSRQYATCDICHKPNISSNPRSDGGHQTHHACTQVLLTCPQCNIEFTIRRSDRRINGQVKQDKIFCSRSCWGSWRWANDKDWQDSHYSLQKGS